ncbi:acyl-CoA thioesterase [Segnochrobactraceae bacterium EtOH-i3]
MAGFAPEDFPAHAVDKLRYGDTDRQGHVNNAVFTTFLETGRCEFLLDPADPVLEPDTSFVIARLELDYRAEVHWPGTVDIYSRVASVGRSSVKVEQAVYQGTTLVATAVTVIVLVHASTRRSHPLSEKATARFRGLMGRAGD